MGLAMSPAASRTASRTETTARRIWARGRIRSTSILQLPIRLSVTIEDYGIVGLCPTLHDVYASVPGKSSGLIAYLPYHIVYDIVTTPNSVTPCCRVMHRSIRICTLGVD
jgi:hypothetical protein